MNWKIGQKLVSSFTEVSEIRLINAWENRDEVIRRCKDAGACKPELKRLIAAKSNRAFRRVLFDNLSWVIDKKILDCRITFVLLDRISFRGVAMKNVYTTDSFYNGIRDWWIDEYGYLVMPYYDVTGKDNHKKKNPPYYEYAKQ